MVSIRTQRDHGYVDHHTSSSALIGRVPTMVRVVHGHSNSGDKAENPGRGVCQLSPEEEEGETDEKEWVE